MTMDSAERYDIVFSNPPLLDMGEEAPDSMIKDYRILERIKETCQNLLEKFVA